MLVYILFICLVCQSRIKKKKKNSYHFFSVSYAAETHLHLCTSCSVLGLLPAISCDLNVGTESF